MMRPLPTMGALGVAALLLLVGWTQDPLRTSPVPAADTTKPLHPLMVELAQDMDRIATGLWHDNLDLVQEGAHGITHHPKIPPEQMAAIKRALGKEFQTFVQYDKRVHGAALNLVSAAKARNWSKILTTHERLQRGCVGCHQAFRKRVRAALHL